MGKITEISVQKKDKNRCNVFIDNEFSFGVSIETAYKHNLKKGKELTQEEIDDILLVNEYDLALNKAINYTTKILKTKQQVITYLRGKGYNDKTIYLVIDKLKELNLINDLEYAKKYIELNNKNGKKLSSVKLSNKGIRKEDIDKALDSVEINYTENAKVIFDKYMRNKEFSKENILKASRYLYGRGFSYDEIEDVVSSCKGED